VSHVRRERGWNLARIHTGLGEEGAEALIGVGGLALLGEIAIGLEERSATATETQKGKEEGSGGDENIPGCHAQGSRAMQQVSIVNNIMAEPGRRQQGRIGELGVWWAQATRGSKAYLPARVGDLATGLADCTQRCQHRAEIFRADSEVEIRDAELPACVAAPSTHREMR
jgi:hypothetical protein